MLFGFVTGSTRLQLRVLGIFNIVEWIRARWARFQDRRGSRSLIVACYDFGIWLENGASEEVIFWEKIVQVIVYKRDCYTVDLICLAILDREGLVLLEVDEGMIGFQELIDEKPRRLDGCLSMGGWNMQVTFPAFETSLTELYRRVL